MGKPDTPTSKRQKTYITLEEKIAVMEAFMSGAPIEHRRRFGPEPRPWLDSIHPQWDWSRHSYRVKPDTPSGVPPTNVDAVAKMVKVMDSHKGGAQIEFKKKIEDPDAGWLIYPIPVWNWFKHDYRPRKKT